MLPSTGSSKRSVDAVTPSMVARWPPAERPKTPMRSGSIPILGGMRAQEAHGRLDVEDGGGERRFAREPVVEARHRIAGVDELGDLLAVHRLVAEHEGAAVDVHDQGQD